MGAFVASANGLGIGTLFVWLRPDCSGRTRPLRQQRLWYARTILLGTSCNGEMVLYLQCPFLCSNRGGCRGPLARSCSGG
ncbi:hypothetical protein F5Y15DRAFT_365350 [Xylariaceae sp. FL0016]|nr:hypothetical protein F5Y15DRAFT_365350 [Xylariaceae sp. FL0016]